MRFNLSLLLSSCVLVSISSFQKCSKPRIQMSLFNNLQNKLFNKKTLISTITAFSILTSSTPAFAFGALEDANNKLTSYGLPPILFVPPGFAPIVSEFGRGNIKEKMSNPVLVQFSKPQLWVVGTTSVNNNGEAGTISANGNHIYSMS